MAHSSRKVHINTLMVHCPRTVHRKCTWWTTVHEASHDRYKEEEPQPFSTQATLQPPATRPSPLSTSSLIECASTSWRFWPGGRKGNQGFVRSFDESDRWQTPTGTRRQEEEVKKKRWWGSDPSATSLPIGVEGWRDCSHNNIDKNRRTLVRSRWPLPLSFWGSVTSRSTSRTATTVFNLRRVLRRWMWRHTVSVCVEASPVKKQQSLWMLSVRLTWSSSYVTWSTLLSMTKETRQVTTEWWKRFILRCWVDLRLGLMEVISKMSFSRKMPRANFPLQLRKLKQSMYQP